jgi:hypothetical protein
VLYNKWCSPHYVSIIWKKFEKINGPKKERCNIHVMCFACHKSMRDQCLWGSFLGGRLHAHDLVLKVWRDKQGVSKFLETLLLVYLLWKSWVPIASLQEDLATMPTMSFHDLIIFAYSLVKFLIEKKLFTNKWICSTQSTRNIWEKEEIIVLVIFLLRYDSLHLFCAWRSN